MSKQAILLIVILTVLLSIAACSKNKKEVVVEPPRNPLALAHEASSEGLEAFNSKQFDDALVKFNEAIALFNEAAPTAAATDSISLNIEKMNLNIAKVYMDEALESANLEMYDDSITNYQKAVQIYQSLLPIAITVEEKTTSIAMLNRNIAITLRSATRYEEALTYYDKCLETDPGNEELLNAKYQILNDDLKDETRALQVLKDYAEAAGDYKAYLILGSKYAEKNKIADATIYYEKALAINQGPDVLSRMADFYRTAKDYKKSNQIIEQLVATKPDDATLALMYRIMADNYDKLKNASKKVEYWEKSLTIEKHTDTSQNLANHYYNAKNYAKAITYATQVINADPSRAAAFLMRGASYYNTKKYTEAKADLQRIQNDSKYGADATKLLKAIK
jgi:tetratricopeptide (TPR) repeat protein